MQDANLEDQLEPDPTGGSLPLHPGMRWKEGGHVTSMTPEEFDEYTARHHIKWEEVPMLDTSQAHATVDRYMEEHPMNPQPVEGRAETDEQKKQVMDRLLDAWKRSPQLRLGQLIYIVTGGNADEVLFNIEDFPLVAVTEEWAKP
jgi:hypothetical protein